jgi:hypothetical protein
MTAPVDLSVIRGERQEKCQFCDGPEHGWKCPRIRGLGLAEDGSITEIFFWRFWIEDGEPPDAA